MATNLTATTGAIRSASAGGNTIMQRFRTMIAKQKEIARLRGELDQMSVRELADLGLSVADIPDVARGTYRRG